MSQWDEGINRLILKPFVGKCHLEFLTLSGAVMGKAVVEMSLKKGTVIAKAGVQFTETNPIVNIKVKKGRHWLLIPWNEWGRPIVATWPVTIERRRG